MASILANSLRSGKRAKDSQGSDQHLSKVVELNGKYRLFFRTWEVEDGILDIAAAMVPGRSCNLDICGTTFVPYSPEMYKVEEAGQIEDLTALRSWSRISRVIFEAQCTREKKNAENEATRTAQELGQPIDQIALARALEGIELKYNGGKAADGTNIMPTERPAISGLQQKMSTQLLAVKLLPTGEPDWKNAKYAVLEFSNARIQELLSILDNPDYAYKTDGYLEVGYDYIGADKKAAGRAAKFQGIAESVSLAKIYPQSWEQFGKSLVAGIAKADTLEATAEIMRSRNRNLKGGKGPTDVISSFKAWCAKNAAVFASINFESDNVKFAAEDFLKENLLESVPNIKAKFETVLEEVKKEKGSNQLTEAASAPGAETAPAQPETSVAPTTSVQPAQVNTAPTTVAEPTSLLDGAGSVRTAATVDVVGDEDLGDL